MSRHLLIATAALGFICSATACNRPADSSSEATADKSATDEALTAELDNLRKANERFTDVKVALAEGYIADPHGTCITADMVGEPSTNGAMGIHYFRPDLLGIVQAPGRVSGTGMYMDFDKPAILMYEPQADGSLKLAGIENLVWTAAWEKSGKTTPPVYQGQDYFQMTDDPNTTIDEAHGFESHYDLHVWLYRENPSGVFSQFNPAVSCEHAAKPPVKS
ncbi:MAG: hypothetical protein ACREMA_10335 [Longimicrobiales bacterium]